MRPANMRSGQMGHSAGGGRGAVQSTRMGGHRVHSVAAQSFCRRAMRSPSSWSAHKGARRAHINQLQGCAAPLRTLRERVWWARALGLQGRGAAETHARLPRGHGHRVQRAHLLSLRPQRARMHHDAIISRSPCLCPLEQNVGKGPRSPLAFLWGKKTSQRSRGKLVTWMH